jgi:hypothetical protein
MTQTRVVGKSLPRLDAVAKVTGTAIYAVDFALPGMLHGKILRSTQPRIGKTNGIFAPPLPPSASAGGRCSRAAMAALSARRGSLPQRRAARRGAA